MKLKIALVLPGFVIGGAERITLDLAKEYKNMGHDVVIVSMISGGNMLNQFKMSGIILKEFDLGRQGRFTLGWLAEVIKARKTINHYLIKEAFDVVHTHLMGPDIDFLNASLKAKTRVRVHTIHNVYRQFASKKLLDRIKNIRRRIAYSKYDHIFAVSDEVKNWAIKSKIVSSDHITTIQNGIDLSRSHTQITKDKLRKNYGFNKDEIIAINIGSLTEQKNQKILINAMKILTGKGTNIRLLIAGKGPLRSSIVDKISALELESSVELLGCREDIPALLKASDLFIFPSLWEGLPVVLLEALACGIPVVASDIPAHRKILQEGRLGWLTQILNPGEIADTISFVLNNYISAEEKVIKAQKVVLENFTIERMAQSYLNSYFKIFKKKEGRI